MSQPSSGFQLVEPEANLAMTPDLLASFSTSEGVSANGFLTEDPSNVSRHRVEASKKKDKMLNRPAPISEIDHARNG